jgi:DNA polymerase-1
MVIDPEPCRRLHVLDLFCGAGAVGLGLRAAGLYVVGVDLEKQPNYCGDEFVQMDAFEYMRTVDLSRFDFIRASPPCKFFTELKRSFKVKKHDVDLITPLRPLLVASGRPWVIENVMNAKRALRNPVMLCASMFPGLETATHQLRRHRLFEASFPLAAPSACRHNPNKRVGGVFGGHVRDRKRPEAGTQNPEHCSGSNLSWEDGFTLMGVPAGSMTLNELSEAIPPVYSRYVAQQWLRQADVTAAPAPIVTFEPALARAPASASVTVEPVEPPPEPAPEPEPPAIFEVDGVVVVYCQDRAEAEALIHEMIADAGARPVALDIETTPILPERQRLEALRKQKAILHANMLGAGRALRAAHKAIAKGEPHDDRIALEEAVHTLAREEKRLTAQVDYAASAGLDPHRSHIRLVQLYGGGARAAVVDAFKIGQNILTLLEGADAVIHNAAFELAHLGHIGVELGKVHDTQQAAKLALGVHKSKLAAAVKHYHGVELDKDEQAGDWAAPILTEAQRRYAARDVIWLWRLCQPLFRDIAPQISAYKVQIAAVPAIARMNRAGITLDLAEHAKVLEAFAEQDAIACGAYRQACRELGKPDLGAKVPRSDGEVAAFLKAVLTEQELGQWKRVDKPWGLSTARPELRKAIHYAPVAPLIELSELDGVRLSFGETLRSLVSPVTGRLHPSYQVCGAPSGRSSCVRPNIQGVPRNPKIRAVFKAADGYVFVAADYNCMELRAAAYFFDDLKLAAVFERGEDPHKITASRVTGKPIEAIDGDERTHAKATNFGTIYGIGPGGLIEQIWKNARRMIGMAEAEDLLAAFERLYPDLMAHRREYVRVCQVRGAIVIGKDWREGKGRIVPFARLPKDQSVRTCCLAYPIQGMCSDICMKAIADVDRRLRDERIDGRLVGWIHDELIVEARERDAAQVKALLKDTMERAFVEVFPTATLLNLIEANVGPNWAAVKEKKKGSEEGSSAPMLAAPEAELAA